MKKLTFLRYWNVITICLFCVALACLGIFFASGKSGQNGLEVLPAQTEISSVETFADAPSDVGADEQPAFTISQHMQVTDKNMVQHTVQWKVKISNFNANKYDKVIVTIMGCALPPSEQYTEYASIGGGHVGNPIYGSYFNSTPNTTSSWLPNQAGSTKVTTYTYTSAKGSANGNYTVSPGQELIITSFDSQPRGALSSTAKYSNLFVYSSSSSSSAQKQYNQQYGTTQTFTVDTVDTDGYGATYITSYNNQSVTNKGKYLKSWSASLGTDAKFQNNVFTFGATDSKMYGVWEDLTYKILYLKNGQQMGISTVKYQGTISGVPTNTMATSGYRGYYDLLGAPVTNGTTFYYADYGSTLIANWKEVPNDYTITWNANGGAFESGATVQYTTTTFGQLYTMPSEVTRPGYTFKGWYTGTSETSTTAKLVTNSTRLSSVNEITLHARWDIKKDLTVRFNADSRVQGFDLKITDVYNGGTTQTTNWQYIKDHSHTFTNVFGLTEFEVSNMVFQDGWVFYQFNLKNTKTGLVAEKDVDYALSQNGDKYIIKAFSSLEITVTSCIKLTLQAVSNFSGTYSVNNDGGQIAIGSEGFKNQSTAVVPQGQAIKLSAKTTGLRATFLGFYSAFDGEGVSEENLLSPAGAAVWTTSGISKTQTIYAVFKFEHYTVNVFAYSDDKNFLESDDLTENMFDATGGRVAAKASFDSGAFTFASSAKVTLPDGYNFNLGISINASQKPNSKYIFVGFYTSFEEMKADVNNTNASLTSTNPTITLNGKDITYYAKFVLQYAFIVSAGTEGITSVSVGNASAPKSASQYYVYGQKIGAISCKYDTTSYNLRSPVWKLVSGDLADTQTKLLATQTITSIGTMPAGYVEISAGVEEKFFTITIVALYADLNTYAKSVVGGTGNITSSKADDIVFGSDKGVMTTHHTITASVKYKSSAITLNAITKTATAAGTNYVFMGWFNGFANNAPTGTRLDGTNSGGVLHINSITGAATYYCAFAKAFAVQITADNRVDDVVFEGLSTSKTQNQTAVVFNTLASYNQAIKFEVKLARGLMDKYTQTQSGAGVKITTNETMTIFEFTMPNYPVYISLTTKANDFYLLTLRSYFVDDMQGYYDTDKGFEKNSGTVSLDEVATAGTTLRQHVEVSSIRTLVATPGVGYSFVGWYKLRTEVSFTEILKDGAPNYRTAINDWFNLYDPITNPNGPYTFFSNDAVVKSDAIERLDKNLYVAVFVKDYNLTLMAGDKGITDITFAATTTFDRDNDGNLDALEPEFEDQGSYKLITAPYGTIFDVWAFTAENYQFAEYQIISGGTSLLHYAIANGKILASDGKVLEEDDWNLNFYIYDTIQILARTFTTYAELTVSFFTYDINGEPVTSMEGGTFNGATEQGQTFDIAIGTSLIGFIKTTPGFVFSHFEIGGQVQPHGIVMPSEAATLAVFFDRNAYILETHIKSIGADEILRDHDEGGAIYADYSITFGDKGTLNLVATIGYQIEGIYLDEACTILAPNFEEQMQATQEIIDYCFHYVYTTETLSQVPETPTTPAFTFYVVYKLRLFDIFSESQRTDLNTQTSTEIEDAPYSIMDFGTNAILEQGYYGQNICIELPADEKMRYYNFYDITITGKETGEKVDLKFFVDGAPAEITESGFGCLADGVTIYFIMPLEEVTISLKTTYYQMNLVFDAETNTGTYQNEYVSPGVDGKVQAFVYYNFDNYTCKDENSIKTDMLSSGVPYATKIGFKLVAYNTMPDRSGVDFITYDYDQYDNVINITINDFVFAEDPAIWQAPITLYAVYDYANIDMIVNYCQSSELFYNGKLQQVLQAELNNFNAEIPYIFTWIDPNGDVVGKYDFHRNTYFNGNGDMLDDISDFYIATQIVDGKTISILQIRSANQSGTYVCHIEIEGGMVYTPNTPVVADDDRFINIQHKVLNIYLERSIIYYGPTTLGITESNVTGLILDLHTISGTITMSTPAVYDAYNPPAYNLKISRLINGDTTQDGFDILSNYKVNFTGSCEIKEDTGFIPVTAGVYLRVIDAIYMEEIFRTIPETNFMVYNMVYEGFEDNSQRYGQGVIISYLEDSDEKFGKTLSLSYDYRFGFGLYQLRVNGEIINPADYEISETTITFTLDRSFVKDDKIDIQVYVTNESLVTAHYNIDGVQDVVMKQVYNQTFNAPSPVTPAEGFTLDGWYFDETFNHKVQQVWQTTGAQDIYAKWVLKDLSQNLSIVVKDNGQIQTLEDGVYEKTYNANAVSVEYAFTLPGFTIETFWFKQSQFRVWQPIVQGEQEGLFNVSQSGIYSFSATITADNGQKQVINVGNFTAEVVILPKPITLADGIFDKTYDGKVGFRQETFVNVLKGQLKVEGVFAQKDVLIEGGEVAPIEIQNLRLINFGGELAENYYIVNEAVKGKILPLNVSLLATGTKVYDGTQYSVKHQQKTAANEYITFLLKTNSSDVGTYQGANLAFESQAASSALTNYALNLDAASKVEITKGKHNFAFKNKVEVFNGETHKIVATYNGEEISNTLNGVADIQYTYTQNGLPISNALPINAGIYRVTVVVTSDKNFEDYTATATLTIKKAVFNIEFLLNGEEFPSTKVFDGVEEYDLIEVKTDVDDSLKSNLNMRLVVTKDGGENAVTSVKNVGIYKIAAEYNTSNFESSSQNYIFYTITGKIVVISDVFEDEVVYTYNAKNHLNSILVDALKDETFADICNFEVVSITRQNIAGVFAKTTDVIVAGTYKVVVAAEVKDQASFAFDEGMNIFEILVKVNPFEITAFESANISKTYDGKTQFEGEVVIKFFDQTTKTETISGEFENANAESDKAIINFTLSNSENYVYSVEDLASTITGEVVKKSLSISLKNNGQFVNVLYKGSTEQVYEINETNQKYVLGLVEGEQLYVQISCNTANFTDDKAYALSLVDEAGVALVLLNTAQIIANNSSTFANYEITSVDGGLFVLKQQQIIAEIIENGDGFDNVYENSAKAIYAKLNDILCVYDVGRNLFVAVNNGQTAPAEVGIKDYTPYVDADTHNIVLTLGDNGNFSAFMGGTVIDGQQCIELTYTIVPYQLQKTEAINAEYGDALSTYSYSDIAVANLNGNFTFKATINLSGQDTSSVGTFELSFNTVDNSDILTLTSSNANVSNFSLLLDISLVVGAKSVIVGNVAFNDYVYTGQDQKNTIESSLNLAFTDATYLTPITLDEDAFTIVYYQGGTETSSVINAGTYSVMIFANDERYVFNDGNGNYYSYKELGTFEITKAALDAEVIGNTNLVFDANFHAPLSAMFSFNGTAVPNVYYKITYGNNLEAVKDAGTYAVNLEISNSNFVLGSVNDVSVVISPYQFALTPPENGEVWFSKFFGTADPATLTHIFHTPFGDMIEVNFVRAAGEDVGQYEISLSDEEKLRLAQTYKNYEILPFEDVYGGFHILSYKDVSGQLTIEMLENIRVEYSGEFIQSISLQDYPNTFRIYDNQDQPISSDICDLSNVVFGFEYNQIKDVGTYNLVILSVESTTHDDFRLILGGKQFLITPKTISVELQDYQKVYDATLDAPIELSSVVGICDDDFDTITITGRFDDKNVGNDKTIHLGIAGVGASNYVLGNQTALGDITAREVVIEGTFDKIYDGQTIVDPSNFLLLNVCSGDNLAANGHYEDKHVGENKNIIFTLDGTDAQNYTLGTWVYTGTIYQKTLTFAQKDFSKQYDSSPDADVSLLDIEGIADGDDITIEKAQYVDVFNLQPDATVGDKYLQITFAGADKDNYVLDLLPTAIKLRYITLQYHYGDEADYMVEFVADGENINKGIETQEVAYGFAVNYPLYNEINTLASPSRAGYDFVGWTLDKANLLGFTEATNTNIVDIQTLAQNNWTIHLYAVWQIQKITLQIVVMTENIANNDFAESELGGTFTFDGQSTQTRIECAYHETHTIVAIANQFFNFVSIEFNGEVVSTRAEYQFQTSENATIKLNFARSEVSVVLHTGDFEVSGFNETIWQKQNETLVATTKYNGVLKLPALSTYGHTFGGCEDESKQPYAANSSLTVMTTTFELWALFTPKTVQIAVNTNGGVGDENFAYADKDNKIIEVVYGAAFGTLPTLQKTGYEFVSFMLYNGINLIEKVDSSTILKTADTNLMLMAVWDKNDNKFEVSGGLKEDYYADFGITNFEKFDNPFVTYYNLGQGSGFVEYTGAFTAPTESVVTFKILNSQTNIYQFAYWEVDGEVITSELQKDGTSYKLLFDGELTMLQISGFVWENACPNIAFKYIPTTLNFEIADYDTTRGAVASTSGVVNGQTLAGAKIELSYTENVGFHLNTNRTTSQNANIVYGTAGQVILEKVIGNVIFAPVFSQNEYGFTITKSGFTEGVAYVKYAINDIAMTDYVTQTMIKTGDRLLVKIALLNGYTMQITADKPEVVITQNSSNQLASAKEVFIDVSSFLGAFNINIEIGKEFYNVSAQKKLYNPLTGLYASLSDNTITVQDAFGQDVSKVAYLEKVVFTASVNATQISQYGKDIQNVEYKFMGWFAEINGEMILVCGAQTYQFDVVEDVEYVAVFEKVVFSVTFLADDNFGKIVGTSQEVINRVEYITAGNTLQGTYQVLAVAGYKFTGWNVEFVYNDANKTTITQTLSDALVADLGEIHANITATATFAKIDISVNLSANRLDGKELSETTSVQFGESTGHNLDITTQTRTTLTFKAIAGVGYQFAGWIFENHLQSEYNIISSQISTEYKYDEESGAEIGIDKTIHTIEVEFIGQLTSYKVVANFDVADVKITTTFAVQNIDVVAAGVIVTENGEIKNATHSFLAKAESTITFYVNIFEGFTLFKSEEVPSFTTDNINITVQIIDATSELSAEEKLVFSERYKVIVDGFSEDTTINIWGDSQKTTLNFAKLSSFFDNTFVENAFTGYIKYYTNEIVVDEGQTLSPKENNCVFVGWSTTKNANGMITDARGNLIENYWTSLEKEVSLYPIYDYATVRVDVVVAPNQALVNPYDYLQEVFDNSALGFTIENGLYYYNIGASFSLGVPELVENYHFDSFVYHMVNAEGQIQKVTIKAAEFETNFAQTKMFHIPSESAFDYSLATNFANFDGLEDGVMQITILCSVDINYKAENYYTENCQEVIGGTIHIANLSNTFMAVYNQEVQLVAVPDEGYTVKEWWVNGVKLDAQTLTLPYQVVEPTEFVVKFVGKRVAINLDATNAESVELTGGNAEMMDEGTTYIRHVGDIVYLSAIAGEGYLFTNNWRHSNGGQIGSEYIITAADGESGEITLTPAFEAKKIQVYMLMPYGFGAVSKDGLELSSSRVGDNMQFVCSISYFDDLELSIKPIQKYYVSKIMMSANGETSNVSAALTGESFILSHNVYNNAQSLTFTITVDKLYWYSYITEKSLVKENGELVVDLNGSGKKEDPYRITSIQDLVKLAYVINNGIVQTNTAVKNSYNGATTYYEITMKIDLQERFWTPIGTSENPFNCNMVIYYMPSNITNHTADPYFSFDLFDNEVLEEYSGLFGYLGENANIQFKVRDTLTLVYIIGGIILLIIAIVIILVLVHKSRANKLQKFDEKNNFLFDTE